MRFFFYCLWLIKQIVCSTWKVTKAIWQPKLRISPCYGLINSTLKNAPKQAIFANSITLTPGTFTMELANDQLLVHSLFEEDFSTLPNGQMEQSIARLKLGIK